MLNQFLNILCFVFCSTNISYAQTINNTIQLKIKQENKDSLNLLTFELSNLSSEVFKTTAVGLQNNKLILIDEKGQEIKYAISCIGKKISIESGVTKKWKVDIDEKLNLCSHFGFQKPNKYIIKWEIMYWYKQKEKRIILSEPFYYEKTSYPDIICKIRTQEQNKGLLEFIVANAGDGDTVLVSNAYQIIITDVKGHSIIHSSNFYEEQSTDIFLLQSRFRSWNYNIRELIEAYKLPNLEKYTLQWKISCSDLQKTFKYELESTVFHYTPHE